VNSHTHFTLYVVKPGPDCILNLTGKGQIVGDGALHTQVGSLE